ncbi:cation:proton antiporter [Falsibacillus pallidus]|uniref:cation:proton antiporter n=1 Tax=Falsibacillus pallidus TaxID=493781 RepID=UPI000E0B5F44|nr:cation:proton antiporter [Falsibacillus pallidus]
MHQLDPHYVFELGLLMIMIAAGITAAAKKFKQPYPIVLVVFGALIGSFNIPALEPLKTFITQGEIFHFVVITLFLPALIGEASLKLPYSHLKDNKKPIFALAFGGTLISFLVVGFSMYYLFDFNISTAFVFAALMSATDPVSVLSIFKNLGVQKRLSIVVEGESLFNDGLAVVFFNISSFYLLSYLDAGWSGFGSGLLEFIKVISIGLIVGGGLGYAFSILTKYYDDYPLEIIFSIILFYGSFLLSESLQGSGVIAVVVASIIFGNFGAKIGMSPTTKLNISNFWEVAALLANSLVFLMVGLEITRIHLADKWWLIIAAIVIVLVARSIAVYTSLFFIKSFPLNWKHLINWGGLKGSLSIALALSLPQNFPGREDIVILSFSVVLTSLIVQGLTVKPLISFLGIKPKSEQMVEYEYLIAELHRYDTAVQEIHRIKQKLYITEQVSGELIAQYEKRKDVVKAQLNDLYESNPAFKEKQLDTLQKHVLYAEHEAIDKLLGDEIISSEVAEKEHEEVIDSIVQIAEKHH